VSKHPDIAVEEGQLQGGVEMLLPVLHPHAAAADSQQGGEHKFHLRRAPALV